MEWKGKASKTPLKAQRKCECALALPAVIKRQAASTPFVTQGEAVNKTVRKRTSLATVQGKHIKSMGDVSASGSGGGGGGGSSNTNAKALFVGNIDSRIKIKDLNDLFSRVGRVDKLGMVFYHFIIYMNGILNFL